MRRWWRIVLIVIVVLLVILLVGPFLIPIPSLEGTVPPEQLADPDSHFVDVNGLQVHYKMAGQGEPTMVLLHGLGASVFSWREVMEPLSEVGTVIAFDRPAFGLTERPLPGDWIGENPYRPEAQPDLTVALMDELGVEKAVLVGHSAGGTIAVHTALRHPERVEALVLVAPAVYHGGGGPAWARLLVRIPQVRHLGPLLVRNLNRWSDRLMSSAWHDPNKITSQIMAGYRGPLQAENWDRALWEFFLASHPLELEAQLHKIQMPTLVITGDDDHWVPTEQSVRLASELPNAELVVIPECGHLPQEERPEPFLQAVTAFLNKLP